jgi:hypothetical protein
VISLLLSPRAHIARADISFLHSKERRIIQSTTTIKPSERTFFLIKRGSFHFSLISATSPVGWLH